MNTNTIPADFFVTSELAGRELAWGKGAKVFGDSIPQAELAELLVDIDREAGLIDCDCDSCGKPIYVGMPIYTAGLVEDEGPVWCPTCSPL